jgi:hypothetical protein
MQCPFRLCTAWFLPTVERAAPDTEETIKRVPSHNIEGIPAVMQCPASYLPVPLNEDAETLLAEIAPGIERMLADMSRPAPFTTAHDKRTGPRTDEHSKTPHPGPSQWFDAGNQGGGPNLGEAAQGRPVVRPLPGQGVSATGQYTPLSPAAPAPPTGGASNSMEDHASMANGLLEQAKQLIGEIQTSISALTDDLEKVAASAGTFQERGENIVGAIVQAAEGSQTHNHRIQDAMATVHYATNDETASLISTVHEAKEALDEIWRKLGAAHEDLEQVIF